MSEISTKPEDVIELVQKTKLEMLSNFNTSKDFRDKEMLDVLDSLSRTAAKQQELELKKGEVSANERVKDAILEIVKKVGEQKQNIDPNINNIPTMPSNLEPVTLVDGELTPTGLSTLEASHFMQK